MGQAILCGILLICMVLGYLLGSLNTSILVGRAYGVNIKKEGSKNAGMSNTMRVLGKKAGIFVILGDVTKGVLACLIGYFVCVWMQDMTVSWRTETIHDGLWVIPTAEPIYGMFVGGLGAVLGHNWPVYFRFQGGKGVLTSFAVLLVMDWRPALIALGVFALILLIMRYVSVASMLAAVAFFVLYMVANRQALDWFLVTIVGAMCLLVIVMHHSNIKRLLKGEEHRLQWRKRDG